MFHNLLFLMVGVNIHLRLGAIFFSLFSRLNIDDLISRNEYAIFLKLKLCYTPKMNCEKIITLLENSRCSKVNCTTDQFAINGMNFELYTVMK